MVSLKDLKTIANKIEDETLRNKTLETLEIQVPSNEAMDYRAEELEEIPSWIGAHHSYKGGLIEHIYSVTKLALSISEILEEIYNKQLKKDFLIAGALLHDISKLFILKKVGEGYDLEKYLLDHALWSACELYARSFPEEVIEIVGSHGGEKLPPSPVTLEGTILQLADDLDARAESFEKEDLIYVIGEELEEEI